ncbi:hypothetical protein RUMLAC_01533 [[Ruminococcus] lactaris ATCC 29176]|uniref:Uncharacterized protein n=1 Tax=[Ruminococcus] lactaris ATCC 29176 TaxID=471875 RepID=B5CPY8_9FIRM|nr:hypothetical protein RUMLAC_01533 [[Ruminococcus] lactaris ATCC 29176]
MTRPDFQPLFSIAQLLFEIHYPHLPNRQHLTPYLCPILTGKTALITTYSFSLYMHPQIYLDRLHWLVIRLL